MFPPRFSRLAAACRLLFTFFVLLAVAPAALAATLTGRVIDPDGRAVGYHTATGARSATPGSLVAA